MIAMALALRPEVLIADEPTTALDVTVQREVLDLLRDLQRELGTAIILITHDMGVVAEMADRVIVMRQGRQVETAPTAEIFARPRAEYTRALLAAVPRIGQGAARPMPWNMSALTSAGARPSRWWGNRAAANPPSPRRWSVSLRIRDGSRLAVRRWPGWTAPH